MASITLKGNAINTSGNIPAAGSDAPKFQLVNTALQEVGNSDFSGKRIVLNIFPSIDTGTCAQSTRTFNEKAASLDNTVVLCVSSDLPFAHKRFCEAEGIENVIPLSEYRDRTFGNDFGLRIVDGPLAGLLSRVVVVIDESGKVVHSEQVPEITEEPNYDAAISALS